MQLPIDVARHTHRRRLGHHEIRLARKPTLSRDSRCQCDRVTLKLPLAMALARTGVAYVMIFRLLRRRSVARLGAGVNSDFGGLASALAFASDSPVPICVVGKCVESCAVPTPLDLVRPAKGNLAPKAAPGRRAAGDRRGPRRASILIVEALAIPFAPRQACAHVEGCRTAPSHRQRGACKDRRRFDRRRKPRHRDPDGQQDACRHDHAGTGRRRQRGGVRMRGFDLSYCGAGFGEGYSAITVVFQGSAWGP